MATPYPLYYTLIAEPSSKKDLSQEQKEQLAKEMNLLDEARTEAVFMLICEHYRVKRNKIDKTKLPYSSTQKKNGVTIDLDKLPIELKWILYKFVVHVVKTDI